MVGSIVTSDYKFLKLYTSVCWHGFLFCLEAFFESFESEFY